MNLNATLIAQFVVFFVLAWFTMKFVWPPLTKALDERAKKIADGLAAADRGAKSLEDAQVRIVKIEQEARQQAQAIAVEAEKMKVSLIAEARQLAKAEGDKVKAQAMAEIQQQMVRVKADLREQLAGLAVAGAEQILRREVTAENHAKLLNDLKEKF